MRVTLTRSGGLAGLLPPPQTLDTATLPRPLARRIEELVATVDFFNLPHTLAAPSRQPDRFQFTLSITGNAGQEHTVTCDEEAASEPFRELIHALQKAASRH